MAEFESTNCAYLSVAVVTHATSSAYLRELSRVRVVKNFISFYFILFCPA